MDALATLRLVAPEFSAVSDEDVASWISLCTPLVSKKKFGALYDQALALLAAHRMKASGNYEKEDTKALMSVAGSGRVASYTEGQTSISFTAPGGGAGGGAGGFELTDYGRQYLDLRKAVIVPITIRRGR